jgi:hypothetical protein
MPGPIAARRLTASTGPILTRFSDACAGCAPVCSGPKASFGLMTCAERLDENDRRIKGRGSWPAKGARSGDVKGAGLVNIGSTYPSRVPPGFVLFVRIAWKTSVAPSYGGLSGRMNWFAPHIPWFVAPARCLANMRTNRGSICGGSGGWAGVSQGCGRRQTIQSHS